MVGTVHTNLIQYYSHERGTNFIDIVMELAICSLNDEIMGRPAYAFHTV